ncbi:11170_t:CDS:2, partial [Funneliformis geosporum]
LPKVKQIFDNIKPDKEEKTILAKADGKIISIEEKIIKQKSEEGKEIIYSLGKKKKARVSQGDLVKKGERLTGGKVDLEELLEIMGRNNWLPPEKINQLSFGNITSHKLINIRTLKPEPGGLFDPRIFGPFLNYECYCGKYKGKENKGQKLPVVNIALFKILATNLSKLLGIPTKKLEDIIYLRVYVVVDNGSVSLLKKGEVLEKRIDQPLISGILQEVIQEKKLTEKIIKEAEELNEKIIKANDKNNKEATDIIFLEDYLDFFEKHSGIEVKTELAKVKEAIKEAPQKTNQEKLKFLQVVKLKEEDVIASNQHNNSLDRIILRCSTYRKNEIKSLLQSLSGKEGILRRYSLGKRVDYSARSVIIPNPNLLLDQIGLPVKMALTLYKPFVIQKILKEKIAFTVKEAEQLFHQEDPVVFSLLNEIIQGHPVLANRAPSLHRLSIQGFYPQLTLGNAIELHPLVTTALNADFDGDQIAIHLPMTTKTCEEVKELILSTHHIIDPKNGHLITIPSQDMILGLHDLVAIPATLVGRNFSTTQNQFLFTTLGKIVFNQILPASFPYYINDLKKYNEEDNQNNDPVELEQITKK